MIRIGCLLILASSAWAQRVTFDSATTSAAPPDWTVAMTHEGGAPKWEIVSDPSAPSKPNVLAQTSTEEGGKRLSLEPKDTPSKTYGVKHKVPKQTWSTLKVSFDGPRFEVFFDGAKIMEVEYKTFTAPGKTGVSTKADSVTYFDDFQIEKKY